MRALRWGLVLFLSGAALVMKAPVWFLIAHIDLTGASSGYHRAMLVDQFIRHVGDWWLVGVKDASVWGFDMWDTCNQYVQEGESGGLVAFVFFLVVIVRSFARVGAARRAAVGIRDANGFSGFWAPYCSAIPLPTSASATSIRQNSCGLPR